uniref:Uncharacterized protein n=1 Tax=Anguilla anguilla TaxID=7936 RepID=A0A0E9XX10_ANGAN
MHLCICFLYIHCFIMSINIL